MIKSAIVIDKLPEGIGSGFNSKQFNEVFHGKSFVVSANSSHSEYSNHWGLLSIKCAFNGSEFYRSRNATYSVNDANYLIFNEGTYRSSSIKADRPVHSFSITFSPTDANQAIYSFLTKHDRLLDNPFQIGSENILFTEKLYEHDQVVSPYLSRILELAKSEPTNESFIGELLILLLHAMIQNQQSVWHRMEQVNALRPSTQKELFERIHRAKDFMSSCYYESLTLESISGVACLNPYYFLREFKKMMHVTPHQYLQKIRLAQACKLLKLTDHSVNEICNAIGFSDPASFCKLFKRVYRVTPSEFRQLG